MTQINAPCNNLFYIHKVENWPGLELLVRPHWLGPAIERFLLANLSLKSTRQPMLAFSGNERQANKFYGIASIGKNLDKIASS